MHKQDHKQLSLTCLMKGTHFSPRDWKINVTACTRTRKEAKQNEQGTIRPLLLDVELSALPVTIPSATYTSKHDDEDVDDDSVILGMLSDVPGFYNRKRRFRFQCALCSLGAWSEDATGHRITQRLWLRSFLAT